MSRALILHVGVQKTGTTSLQRFLRRSAPVVADSVTIRTPEEGTPMRPLGRAAIACSLTHDDDHRARLVSAFEAVLDDLPGDDRPVILSHENLAGAMPGNGGETRLFPVLPAILTLLVQVAKARGFAPHVVVYTRRMTAWLPSVWAQAVRTDGYAMTLPEFQAQTAELPGWGDLLRRLNAALSPVSVTRLRLEDEADAGRPGLRLLSLAGVPDARLEALPPLESRAMERLTPGATEFLRRLNGLALNPHARDRVADLVARSQPLFAANVPSEGTL
ncbi:hypothetical protein [Paracoccus sp. Ld10]|uniref:hypothetical protein n=1 Tax=Paracoccus sp. Ld10 TaxID=649158 RepID=UPI0038694BB5